MVKADLRVTRQILEAQLKESTLSKALGGSIQIHQAADPVDMTQEAAQRDMAVQILDRESALVRNLRSAIERITDGSYGVCLECEKEITPARLKAIPWAERCVHCQERAEKSGFQRERIPAFEAWNEAA